MRGVPMVATSPVRHESPIQINPIEVQTYQPPWKALTEYALQPEIDPSAPHFQQIVSQVRQCAQIRHVLEDFLYEASDDAVIVNLIKKIIIVYKCAYENI